VSVCVCLYVYVCLSAARGFRCPAFLAMNGSKRAYSYQASIYIYIYMCVCVCVSFAAAAACYLLLAAAAATAATTTSTTTPTPTTTTGLNRCAYIYQASIYVCVCECFCVWWLYTPERHLPTPGQHGHGPQRHTAAGTAAPTTADTGNTVPQRASPTQTAYAHPRRRAQAQGQRLGTWTLVRPQMYMYVCLRRAAPRGRPLGRRTDREVRGEPICLSIKLSYIYTYAYIYIHTYVYI